MRIIAIILLGLFVIGVLALGSYAEKSTQETMRYGNDGLIRAIRKHVEHNPSGRTLAEEGQSIEGKHVINFNGRVEHIPPPSKQKVYNEPAPVTNEGMPGQPLPFTGSPPMAPVYK